MAHHITLGKAGKHQQRGFGYLAVLFIVLLLALALGTTYEQIDLKMKREKEQEWLFVGKQYQQAIASYYNESPSGIKELPTSLDDLLLDKRFVSKTRHLRKRFLDPLTGDDWTIITNDNKQITGVYSTSNASVLQVAKLSLSGIVDNEQAQIYSDIKFEFLVSQAPPASDSEEAPAELGAQAPDNALE
jgi:type II secretory pathway pseudopilin PulG